MTFQPINSNAVYLPETTVLPTDPAELIIRLTKIYTDIATRLNDKEISLYENSELMTAEEWFTPGNNQTKRFGFRKVVPFSPLVAGLNSFPHGIVGIGATFTFTHIYGTARNAAGTVQVPLPQGGANTSMLEIDATNVNVTIPAAYAGFSCLIVLEYLKN